MILFYGEIIIHIKISELVYIAKYIQKKIFSKEIF